MKKWILEEDQLTRRRIAKTGEEVFELITVTTRLGQILMRVLLQGIEAVNPSTHSYLREELHKEIADVYAQLDETVEELGLDIIIIESRRHQKRNQMKEWESLYKTNEQ